MPEMSEAPGHPYVSFGRIIASAGFIDVERLRVPSHADDKYYPWPLVDDDHMMQTMDSSPPSGQRVGGSYPHGVDCAGNEDENARALNIAEHGGASVDRRGRIRRFVSSIITSVRKLKDRLVNNRGDLIKANFGN